MAFRVLLVDDNESHLDLLRVLIELEDELELAGVAGDGEAGVAAAAELQPELIVSDIEMPNLDGLSAVPRYRRAAPSALVVLMSSRSPSEAARQARTAGADLYLDKGTGVETVMATLRAALRAAAASRVVDIRGMEPEPSHCPNGRDGTV